MAIERLYSAGEVAEMLGISRQTVAIWRRTGRIIAHAIELPRGTQYGYRLAEIARVRRAMKARGGR